MIPPLLMTRRETAQSLRISLRKLDELIAKDEIPVCRLGRRVLFSPAALDNFIRRQMQVAHPQETLVPQQVSV